ncbi:MAG: DedA family protein [Rickettsiales bacterium]|jgi:membrane protein YqaA with SNARE-associated domain|nr:DedA family protein [Rickettsiales bacterium]
MKKLLKQIYDWALRVSKTEYAVWGLVGIAFFGSTVFPLPTEIIMIPMMFAAPKRAWHLATIALIASILGGVSGYYLGYLFAPVGESVLGWFGYAISDFAEVYERWGYWFVFAGGLTPFPYKIICIASGMIHINLAVFVTASLVSRAVRYYLIAGAIFAYGDRARRFIEKHLELLSVVLFVLLFAAVYFMR